MVMENEPEYILETGFCTGRSASVVCQQTQKN